MSLLLDALKKAAADKEKAGSVSEPDIKDNKDLPEEELTVDDSLLIEDDVNVDVSDEADTSGEQVEEELELDLPEVFELDELSADEESTSSLEEPSESSVNELEESKIKKEVEELNESDQLEEDDHSEADSTDEVAESYGDDFSKTTILPAYNHEDARKVLEVSQKKYQNNQRTFQYGMYLVSIIIFIVISYLYYTAETLDNSTRPAFKPSLSASNNQLISRVPESAKQQPLNSAALTEVQTEKNKRANAEVKDTKIKTEKLKKAKKITIVKQKKPDPISVLLHQAYRHYQSAEYLEADRIYQRILARDKRQRDALLGRAAVAVVNDQLTVAKKFYQLVQHFYPNDGIAQAALVDLVKKEITIADESQLNLLLRDQPDAAYVHFSLGLLYSKQNRLKESQQAFFNAFALEKKADYAYNLAVMLDRLGQPKAALDYYKRASHLSDSSIIHFNEKTVLERIKQLEAVNE